MIGHIYGVIMYVSDRTEEAIAALKKMGLADEPGVFAKRVYSCVVRLLKEFFSQTHTPFSAEFALGLFNRLARGEKITPDFLADQKKRLEAVASEAAFSEDDEEDAWIGDRYGMTPKQAGLIVSPMRAAKKAEAPEPASKSQAKRFAIQGALPERRWLEGYGFAPDAPVVPMFMDDYGSASRLDPDEPEDEGVPETSEPEKEKKDMCLPDTDLVRTVRGAVEGLCEDLTPFTGIDVSNAVKRAGKVVRHREVAPIVRELFTDGEMDSFGYTRDLITVSLPGGRQAQAWLYHHQTSDPSDYDTRAQVALPPKQTAKIRDSGQAKKPDLNKKPLPQPAPGHVPPPAPAAAPAPRGSRMLNTASQQRIQKLDGRLEIPRGWIRKLGWTEGDDIRAVKQGDAIVLKPVGDVGALEEEVYRFTVDRWNRIRLTNRALNKVNRNFGQGGQHVVTLQNDSIKVG